MCLIPEPLYCDTCGEELQRESCNHVRPCLKCTLRLLRSSRIFLITTLRPVTHEFYGSTVVTLEGRTVGWYCTLKEAQNVLIHNYGALDEGSYYPVAVIEWAEPGLYPDFPHEEADCWYWEREQEKWVHMPPAPEESAWMNYAWAEPKKWGSTDYELVRLARYASIG